MNPDHRPGGRPHWWPENEPWPPVRGRHVWRRGRARFVRRVGCLFAVLLVLSAVGATTLISTLLGRTGIVSVPAQVSLLFLIALAGLLILLAAFVAAMRRIGFPLGDIVESANRVANGDFSARVIERGPPPLRSVARAFNSMTGRLQSQDEQRRQLMADIAHELRTPVSVIQGRLEGLLDGVYPRDDQRLGELLEDTQILSRLIEDLRTLANAESGMLALHKEPTDVAILVQEVVNSFAADASEGGVAMRVEGDSNLPLVDVDPMRIRQVLVNLVSNALRHTPREGAVALFTGASADHIIVKVRDTGSGVPPEELPKIFDRFYKGRTSRGSGLGLTIARNLVLLHGGQISAESRINEGTTVTFTLPLQP